MDEWRTVTKKKYKSEVYPKNTKSVNPKLIEDIPEEIPLTDLTDKTALPTKYIFWCHDIYNKDWSINSYIKVCILENISDFWRLFNNLEKLNYKTNNFFLFNTETEPIWEHKNNRNGGICSLRVDINLSLAIYEDLAAHMVCNAINNNKSDINGVSYGPKNNWALIKIWNRDKKYDLTRTLNKNLLIKYKNYSIKYKNNEPEY